MRIFLSFMLVIVFAASALAMGSPAPQKEEAKPVTVSRVIGNVLLIDSFEDNNYTSMPEWWKFDLKEVKVVSTSDLSQGDAEVVQAVQENSLFIFGEANNWYCGGIGTYIAVEGMDLSKFTALQMDVYGAGEGSGTLKIELVDDDNNNWQAEQDPKKNYTLIYDDKWTADITVDWTGWKRITVPFADFVDANPGVGDDVWNPEQSGSTGSGGLLQVQIIALAPEETGTCKLYIDNVSLIIEE